MSCKSISHMRRYDRLPLAHCTSGSAPVVPLVAVDERQAAASCRITHTPLRAQEAINQSQNILQMLIIVLFSLHDVSAVPKEYIPGVVKGLEESMTSGQLAGFPVVDVTTTLFDGSYHEVDSSALAFQIAARGAFRYVVRWYL